MRTKCGQPAQSSTSIVQFLRTQCALATTRALPGWRA
jgi:hypothetical protein